MLLHTLFPLSLQATQVVALTPQLWDVVSESLRVDLDIPEVTMENSWLIGGWGGPRQHFLIHDMIELVN